MALVTDLLEGAINAFGIRTSETPKYDVLLEDAELEIRRYSGYLVAKLFAPGNYADSSESGFQQLSDFIGGHNITGAKLYPEEGLANPRGGALIPMTMPILHSQRDGGWITAFILPRNYTFSTAPRPLEPGIELEQIPPQTMAVLRYSGSVDEERLMRKFRELRGWVQSIGWRSISEPIAAQYDPPFTIPFLKRNEVLIRAEALHS